MPIISIHDEDVYFEDEYREMWLAMFYYKICSFAFFPNSEESRLDYMRHVFGRIFLKFSNNSNLISESNQKKLLEYRNFLGDELAILESSNTVAIQGKLKKIFSDGMILGMALSGMYSLVNTSSNVDLATKEKFAHFIIKEKRISRSQFYNIYDQYKAVGHIWAAIYLESIMDGSPNNIDEKSNYIINDYNRMTDCILTSSDFENFCESRHGKMILNILAWSSEFHKFGIIYTPLRSPRPMLDPKMLWTVPDRVEANLGPLPKLNPEVVKILKGYKAPALASSERPIQSDLTSQTILNS